MKHDWLLLHIYDTTAEAGARERFWSNALLEACAWERFFTKHVLAAWQSSSERAEAFRRAVSQK